MNERNFYKTFWNTYIQIENELIDIFKYVELSTDNYKTYSSKFLKVFLQIGSEIDICFKEYLKLFQSNSASSIAKYKQQLQNYDVDFFDESIEIKQLKTIVKPWEELKNNNTISWWTAYNKVKHERTNQVTINTVTQEAYKFADLENVITSLSGLYVLLMNIFAKIKNNREDSPIPNSKLFNMKSKRWSKCKYFNTIYASTSDNGNIYFDNTINYLMY